MQQLITSLLRLLLRLLTLRSPRRPLNHPLILPGSPCLVQAESLLLTQGLHLDQL